MPIDSRTKYPEIEKIKKKLRKEQERDDAIANRKQQSAGSASPNRSFVKAVDNRDFYKTREWQEARWKAIKKSNGCCVYCGRSRSSHGIIIHVDHIKPRSKFPHLALELSNLQITCEDCNLGKGTKQA